LTCVSDSVYGTSLSVTFFLPGMTAHVPPTFTMFDENFSFDSPRSPSIDSSTAATRDSSRSQCPLALLLGHFHHHGSLLQTSPLNSQISEYEKNHQYATIAAKHMPTTTMSQTGRYLQLTTKSSINCHAQERSHNGRIRRQDGSNDNSTPVCSARHRTIETSQH